MSGFRHRGVVEGYYGTPWSHEDRCWIVEQLGRWGMNRYVYAPKEDPLHRESWREPYPRDVLREFAELVECGARVGVQVGFSLSPGLSIRYASREDRAALQGKVEEFRALGARSFGLLLDDVPSHLVHEGDRRRFDSLAAAHVDLAHGLRETMGPGEDLWLVPTDYLGVGPTDYLEQMGAELDASVEVGWTGRTVLSPTIEAEEAARRAATLRRPLLLWDNTPVADGPMRSMLHLGPYAGRSPGLAAHASGVLLNPMQHARASALTLHTAARYLADPAGYDPEAAWEAAAVELGDGAPAAFALFARAHRFSPLAPDDRDRELDERLAALRDAVSRDADPLPQIALLQRALEARAACAAQLRDGLVDRRLLAEIEPWIVSHQRETARIAAVATFLEALFGDGPRSERVLAFLALQGRLTRSPVGEKASYGPRRVLYPQLGSLRDEHMGFGSDPCLVRDRCLADAYLTWAEELALARLRAEAKPD